MTIRDVALDYLQRGRSPIRLKPRDKVPIDPDWGTIRLTSADVPAYFDRPDYNIGLLLGVPSHGLADVDLDCAEAIRAAPFILPTTPALFGRASAPDSHWFYESDLISDASITSAVLKFADPTIKDPKKGKLLELRVGERLHDPKAAQTLAPGSIHPSGEPVRWSTGADPTPAVCLAADLKRCARRTAAAALLGRHWPQGTGMHNAARLVGGLLRRNNWDTTREIGPFVEAIARIGNDPDVKDRIRTAKDAAQAFDAGKAAHGIPTLEKTFGPDIAAVLVDWLDLRAGGGTAPGSTGHLPAIRLGPNLTETAIVAEQAMLAAELPIWRRDTVLVHPVVVSARGSDNRPTKTGVLAPISPILMRSYMEQGAHFERFDDRRKAFVRVKPPSDIAELILDRAGHSPFHAIRGLLMAPSLRPDGSLLIRPGYDADTELYLIDPPPMAPIPDTPSRDLAQEALNLLCGLLADFPFGGDDDAEAVALSGLITPLVRAALGRVPLHCFSAPEAGTGKSYLVDCCSTLATGFIAPVTSFGRDETELEKSLGAVLIAGHPIISIDNISRPLKGDFLCKMIERPAMKVRLLGYSKDVHIEPQVVPYATGNNLVLVGDIVRRALLCRVDAENETPWLRQFSKAPLKQIAADRGTYIRAALIICRAFLTSGEPPIKPPLGSFEAWSDIVRSALRWLDCGDAAATISATREDDPERQAFAAVLAAWNVVLGSQETTVAELVRQASERDGNTNILINPNLYEALLEIAGSKDGTISHSRLGCWLRSHRDQVLHGRTLRRVSNSTRTGVVRWKLI